MGATHFKIGTLEKVGTEISLQSQRRPNCRTGKTGSFHIGSVDCGPKAQPPGTIAARPVYHRLRLLNADQGNTMAKKTYHGSCHCGAVAFEAKIDFDKGTTRCNCSICTKSRFWFTIVQADDFKIEKGEDQLSDYTWIPPGKSKANLHYRFCETCGVRVFAQGDKASAGGKFYAVAIAALDDIEQDADQIAKSIKYVDGRHDGYDHMPADTRLL
jgi:hypothetical protein